MKRQAEASVHHKHSAHDFLMFDTGDLIEGTGISDATPMHGTYIYPIIEGLPYTALAPGNHDLGQNPVIQYLYENFTKYWGERYVSTNVFYNGSNQTVGGSRALKFKTPNGLRALVFGIIFDFNQAGTLARVQSIEDLVNSTFFADELKDLDDVDIVFAIGHYPPGGSEQSLIFNAIREYAPEIPLIMLAGHSHQLFFNQTDDNSYIVQSDHYFYHIGYVEFDLDVKSKKIVRLQCDFVNTTTAEFMRLSRVDQDSFLTHRAKQLRQTMAKEYDSLNLGIQFGCSPATYDTDIDWSLSNSLFYQFLNKGIPDVLFTSEVDVEHITIVNTGFLRSDMYQGPVIEDDLLSIIPFEDQWQQHVNILGADFIAFLNELGDSSADIALYSGNERFSNEFHHRLIDYSVKARKMASMDTVINQWAKSLNYLTIDASKTYSLISNSYDSRHFNVILGKLFADKYPQDFFNTTLTPRDTLAQFVKQDLLCSPAIAIQ